MQFKLSNTKIKNRTKRKTNVEFRKTIEEASQHQKWHEIVKILSGSTRYHSSVNLFEIDKISKEGDILIIPGKILSKGELTKKVRICGLGISKATKEKLKKSKSEFVQLLDEIKKNPKAEGIKIIR